MYRLDLGFPWDPFDKVEVMGWYVMERASLSSNDLISTDFQNGLARIQSTAPKNVISRDTDALTNQATTAGFPHCYNHLTTFLDRDRAC